MSSEVDPRWTQKFCHTGEGRCPWRQWVPALAGKTQEALCCTDQQLGEVSPPHRHLFEANVFRPPKLQHTVERRDSNGHLGRLPPFGPRAQRVTNHSLVAADIGLRQCTPIVARCPLPA